MKTLLSTTDIVKNNTGKAIKPGEALGSKKVLLRLVTLQDCNDKYVSWLQDPEVNQYLETRWQEQNIKTIKEFVSNMLNNSNSYLFAIIEKEHYNHIGNIKLGPINPHHSFADISYFIGDRSAWGKGYATEAILLITRFGFKRLGLHRLQAGIYASNGPSRRVLEKAGYQLEGTLEDKLKGANSWEDHILYALLNDINKKGNHDESE